MENLHYDFLRQIICLRKVPLYICYMQNCDDTQQKLIHRIKSRMRGFWLIIVNGKDSRLSKLLYSIMLKEHENGSYNFKWICCINDILHCSHTTTAIRVSSLIPVLG